MSKHFKYIFTLIISLNIFSLSINAQVDTNDKAFDLSPALKTFIPKGYKVLDTVKGNLDLDKYSDMIIVLKPIEEDTAWDKLDGYKRPLLLILGKSDSTYKLFTRNDNILYPYLDRGVFQDPYEKIEINHGSFSVWQTTGGASFAEEQVLTFQFSEKNRNWYLIKQRLESWTRVRTIQGVEKDEIHRTSKNQSNFGILSIKNYKSDF